ncbi:RNA-binding ribosome biosynthesis protein mak21 [Entomophthora muscae]|uniref:RNA-binding ribosome biosynthesis protein mak21 n=1 Tax=Entomophthora muscae TaxID=34485 RepID=A0ACC2UPP3_9FUNG|nr:RNA-binding ribosome biosynthesis protein mak21 [Entomophthora muscae]
MFDFSEEGDLVENFDKPDPLATVKASNPEKNNFKMEDKFKGSTAAINKKTITNSEAQKNKAPGKFATGSTDSARLLKEISSLGGSKQDFEFLKDVDSDEEVYISGEEDSNDKETTGKAPNLSDLGKFIKSLGISKIKLEDLDDPEVTASESETEVEEQKVESKDAEESNAAREEPEPEIEFDPKESVVTSQQTSRAFSSSSHLKPNQALFYPLEKPLFESIPAWYELPLAEVSEGQAFSVDYAQSLRDQAKVLLDQENELVSKKAKRSSDRGLLEEIMRSGTLNDKISALTLKVRGAPLHHMTELGKLLTMMARNNRRESLPCLNSFKDLCSGNLLPSDRKLKFFEDQPLSGANVTQKHLVLWYFEDYLKKAFYNFLLLAEARSHDPVGLAKHNMLGHFFDILSSKPEQEANLLTLVVNKLGDKENKVASKASYILLQLIELHPQMKGIVAAEVRALVERPNISLRAQYYASVTLNQFILTNKEVSVANLLVDIYFDLFKKFMSATKTSVPVKETTKKPRHKARTNDKNKPKAPEPTDNEEMISSAVAAVLTGVNRAFPFSKVEPAALERHIETLFRICQTFSFNASIQSLNLLFQISSTHTKVRPRFIKSLYSTLLDPRVIHSSKQALHLNLLFRVLKAEENVSVVAAFMKRMCQVASWHQPPYVNGLIFLIFKLSHFHPIIKNAITHPEDIAPPVDATEDEVINSSGYSGRDDNPAGSKAEYTCLWELGLLLRHFHPTVAHYTRQVLSLEPITEQPQLHHHTLMHFLDRFAFRNAKKSQNSELRGSSIMQPMLGLGGTSGIVWAKGISESSSTNSEFFSSKKPSEVSADNMFFYKYFSLAKQPIKKKAPAAEYGSDGEEEFFKSLIGGMEANEDDEDVDFDDDDMAFNDEDAGSDEEHDLKYAGDAPGFEDFSDVEGQAIGSQDEDSDEGSEGDLEFELDSDDGTSGKLASLKRSLAAESSEEEEEVNENTKRNRAMRERKKKLKALPTFASMEDYADMLSD